MHSKYFCILDYNRCTKCDDLRRDITALADRLNETGLSNVIVGEADCCKQNDFCESSGRETKCLKDEMNGKNYSRLIKKQSKTILRLIIYVSYQYSFLDIFQIVKFGNWLSLKGCVYMNPTTNKLLLRRSTS